MVKTYRINTLLHDIRDQIDYKILPVYKQVAVNIKLPLFIIDDNIRRHLEAVRLREKDWSIHD